jgi:hypothetical protein
VNELTEYISGTLDEVELQVRRFPGLVGLLKIAGVTYELGPAERLIGFPESFRVFRMDVMERPDDPDLMGRVIGPALFVQLAPIGGHVQTSATLASEFSEFGVLLDRLRDFLHELKTGTGDEVEREAEGQKTLTDNQREAVVQLIIARTQKRGSNLESRRFNDHSYSYALRLFKDARRLGLLAELEQEAEKRRTRKN